MPALKDRLIRLLNQKQLSQTQLAERIGVSRQAVQFWTSGRSEPTGKNLYKLADFFEVDPNWLKDGSHPSADEIGSRVAAEPYREDEEDIPDGYVAIPEYHLVFSAGPGEPMDDAIPSWQLLESADRAIYKRSYFQANQINPNRCRRATVRGDSMEPLLYAGDKVLFEENPGCPIIDGSVYVMSFGGDMRIKRLYRKANGDIVLHSDNPRYSDETISGNDLDLIRIYGRVIDRSGSGGL